MLFFYWFHLRNLMWLIFLVKKDLLFNCANSWLDSDHMNGNVFIFQLMVSFFYEMTLWLVVQFLFCYFLYEFEVLLSRKLAKENFTYANDIIKVCNKDGDEDDNVGAMFQWEIAMFPNVGMNLETKTIEEEILFFPDMELKEIFDIELPPKDVGNALHLLEFYKLFGKVWFYVNNLSWCFVWLNAIHCYI